MGWIRCAVACILFSIHNAIGQLQPFCNAPAQRGPCNKLELRYRFNEDSEYCETFLYGGCGGNQNNFKTVGECVKACVDEPKGSICEFPPDAGTCFHATLPRYHFDESSETCKIFYYSGCQGNENNFVSGQECKTKCEAKSFEPHPNTIPSQQGSSWNNQQQSTGGGWNDPGTNSNNRNNNQWQNPSPTSNVINVNWNNPRPTNVVNRGWGSPSNNDINNNHNIPQQHRATQPSNYRNPSYNVNMNYQDANNNRFTTPYNNNNNNNNRRNPPNPNSSKSPQPANRVWNREGLSFVENDPNKQKFKLDFKPEMSEFHAPDPYTATSINGQNSNSGWRDPAKITEAKQKPANKWRSNEPQNQYNSQGTHGWQNNRHRGGGNSWNESMSFKRRGGNSNSHNTPNMHNNPNNYSNQNRGYPNNNLQHSNNGYHGVPNYNNQGLNTQYTRQNNKGQTRNFAQNSWDVKRKNNRSWQTSQTGQYGQAAHKYNWQSQPQNRQAGQNSAGMPISPLAHMRSKQDGSFTQATTTVEDDATTTVAPHYHKPNHNNVQQNSYQSLYKPPPSGFSNQQTSFQRRAFQRNERPYSPLVQLNRNENMKTQQKGFMKNTPNGATNTNKWDRKRGHGNGNVRGTHRHFHEEPSIPVHGNSYNPKIETPSNSAQNMPRQSYPNVPTNVNFNSAQNMPRQSYPNDPTNVNFKTAQNMPKESYPNDPTNVNFNSARNMPKQTYPNDPTNVNFNSAPHMPRQSYPNDPTNVNFNSAQNMPKQSYPNDPTNVNFNSAQSMPRQSYPNDPTNVNFNKPTHIQSHNQRPGNSNTAHGIPNTPSNEQFNNAKYQNKHPTRSHSDPTYKNPNNPLPSNSFNPRAEDTNTRAQRNPNNHGNVDPHMYKNFDNPSNVAQGKSLNSGHRHPKNEGHKMLTNPKDPKQSTHHTYPTGNHGHPTNKHSAPNKSHQDRDINSRSKAYHGNRSPEYNPSNQGLPINQHTARKPHQNKDINTRSKHYHENRSPVHKPNNQMRNVKKIGNPNANEKAAGNSNQTPNSNFVNYKSTEAGTQIANSGRNGVQKDTKLYNGDSHNRYQENNHPLSPSLTRNTYQEKQFFDQSIDGSSNNHPMDTTPTISYQSVNKQNQYSQQTIGTGSFDSGDWKGRTQNGMSVPTNNYESVPSNPLLNTPLQKEQMVHGIKKEINNKHTSVGHSDVDIKHKSPTKFDSLRQRNTKEPPKSQNKKLVQFDSFSTTNSQWKPSQPISRHNKVPNTGRKAESKTIPHKSEMFQFHKTHRETNARHPISSSNAPLRADEISKIEKDIEMILRNSNSFSSIDKIPIGYILTHKPFVNNERLRDNLPSIFRRVVSRMKKQLTQSNQGSQTFLQNLDNAVQSNVHQGLRNTAQRYRTGSHQVQHQQRTSSQNGFHSNSIKKNHQLKKTGNRLEPLSHDRHSSLTYGSAVDRTVQKQQSHEFGNAVTTTPTPFIRGTYPPIFQTLVRNSLPPTSYTVRPKSNIASRSTANRLYVTKDPRPQQNQFTPSPITRQPYLPQYEATSIPRETSFVSSPNALDISLKQKPQLQFYETKDNVLPFTSLTNETKKRNHMHTMDHKNIILNKNPEKSMKMSSLSPSFPKDMPSGTRREKIFTVRPERTQSKFTFTMVNPDVTRRGDILHPFSSSFTKDKLSFPSTNSYTRTLVTKNPTVVSQHLPQTLPTPNSKTLPKPQKQNQVIPHQDTVRKHHITNRVTSAIQTQPSSLVSSNTDQRSTMLPNSSSSKIPKKSKKPAFNEEKAVDKVSQRSQSQLRDLHTKLPRQSTKDKSISNIGGFRNSRISRLFRGGRGRSLNFRQSLMSKARDMFRRIQTTMASLLKAGSPTQSPRRLSIGGGQREGNQTRTAKQDVCKLPRDSGKCHRYSAAYYYDTNIKQCKMFMFTGCGGNGNRFSSRKQCEKTCNVEILPKCQQPRDPGLCKGDEVRYFYNTDTMRCEQFTYSGCEGNDNKFSTLVKCRNTCLIRKRAKMLICNLPSKRGPCRKWKWRYRFDSKTGKCEGFWYGGCLGNKNNFKSKSFCHMQCGQS